MKTELIANNKVTHQLQNTIVNISKNSNYSIGESCARYIANEIKNIIKNKKYVSINNDGEIEEKNYKYSDLRF